MSLTTMCLQGSAMILAIVLMRAFLLKRLPKSVFVFLWTLALLRLLVPFSLVVPFNAWSFVGAAVAPIAQPAPAPETPGAADPLAPSALDGSFVADPAGEASGALDALAPSAMDAVSPAAPATAARPSAAEASAAPDSPAPSAVAMFVSAVLALLTSPMGLPGPFGQLAPWQLAWGLGFVVATVAFVVLYRRGVAEYACSLPVDSEYAREWLSYHEIGRPLQIRQHDRIVSPMTYGLFRPTILVPATFDWSDRGGARIVLEHEFTHVVRWDALRKAVLVAAVCVYWFNPLVWLMFVLANRDIELACDEQVARALTPRGRLAYVRALVELAEARSVIPMASHFGQNAVEERVLSIRDVRVMAPAVVLAVGVFALGMSFALATTPMTAEELQRWSSQVGLPGSLAEQGPVQPAELTDTPDIPAPGLLPAEAAGPREVAMAGARVIVTPHYSLTLFDHMVGEGFAWEYDAQPRTALVGEAQVELLGILEVTLGAGAYPGQSFVVYCLNDLGQPLILDGVSLLGPEYVETGISKRSAVDSALWIRVAVPRACAEQFVLGGESRYGDVALDAAYTWASFVSNGPYFPLSVAEKGGLRISCPDYSVFVPQSDLDAGLTWSYKGTSSTGEQHLSLFAQDYDRLRSRSIVSYVLNDYGFYEVNEASQSVSVGLVAPHPTDPASCYLALAYTRDHASPQAAAQALSTWLPRATATTAAQTWASRMTAEE